MLSEKVINNKTQRSFLTWKYDAEDYRRKYVVLILFIEIRFYSISMKGTEVWIEVMDMTLLIETIVLFTCTSVDKQEKERVRSQRIRSSSILVNELEARRTFH